MERALPSTLGPCPWDRLVLTCVRARGGCPPMGAQSDAATGHLLGRVLSLSFLHFPNLTLAPAAATFTGRLAEN